MSSPNDFDRRLAGWLDDQAPMREPDGLTFAVLARTRRTRRRPGWPGLERWLPLTVITRPALMPPLRAAWLLIILLLTVALAGGVAIVGSVVLTPSRPVDGIPAIAAIPQGVDAILAYAKIGNAAGQIDGDIYTVRADGSDVRQVTQGPGIDSDPTWSPDGTRIAFRRWQNGADSLQVVNADGGHLLTLARNVQSSRDCQTYWSAAWSPDGNSLIFPTRDGCTGGFDLNIVAADPTSRPVKLLAEGTNSLFGAWSPDGSQIAFLGSTATGNTGLYVVDVGPEGALAGGLEARQVAPDVGVNLSNLKFTDDLNQPRWSPDGTELAVTSVTKGPFLEEADGVLVVKAHGSEQPHLLAARGGNPAWSPDGQRLAFQRNPDPSEYANGRPCTVRTWLIDRDGTHERQLDELGDGCGTPPLWSPDGTRLASVLVTPVEGQDPLFRLGVVMVDGSSPPVILGDAYGSWQPVLAPMSPVVSPAP